MLKGTLTHVIHNIAEMMVGQKFNLEVRSVKNGAPRVCLVPIKRADFVNAVLTELTRQIGHLPPETPVRVDWTHFNKRPEGEMGHLMELVDVMIQQLGYTVE